MKKVYFLCLISGFIQAAQETIILRPQTKDGIYAVQLDLKTSTLDDIAKQLSARTGWNKNRFRFQLDGVPISSTKDDNLEDLMDQIRRDGKRLTFSVISLENFILNAQQNLRNAQQNLRKKVGYSHIRALSAVALAGALAYIFKLHFFHAAKKKLIKKYALGKLTPLQQKVWMATLLASYGFPGRLRAVIGQILELYYDAGLNPSLVTFTGKNPRALAELYYGYTPTDEEFGRFIVKFFRGVEAS